MGREVVVAASAFWLRLLGNRELRLNRRDLNFKIRLAVTAFAFIGFAAFEFDDGHFVPLCLGQDVGSDLCIFDEGLADLRLGFRAFLA